GDRLDQNIVQLSREADLLIHEAQYTPEELKHKKGWGHSSWAQAIEVAKQAGVKQLALTHHDPDHNDEFLLRVEDECQKHFPHVVLAREKMEIELYGAQSGSWPARRAAHCPVRHWRDRRGPRHRRAHRRRGRAGGDPAPGAGTDPGCRRAAGEGGKAIAVRGTTRTFRPMPGASRVAIL